MPQTRREFLLAAAALGPSAVLASCTRSGTDRSAANGELIVYCSADSVYAQGVFASFSKMTGIVVRAVYDTEATKTTGLVTRLLEEGASSRARADVWWSSEPFGTIRLARAGILEPYQSAEAESSVAGAWPKHLRDQHASVAAPRWYGFGARARVFGFNTEYAKRAGAFVPGTLDDLLNPTLKGRVALARPEFGTTRGHMAAILAQRGAAVFETFLRGLKENDVRILDGNATVARAIGRGEVYAGLTDSDDVFAGQSERWPIDLRLSDLPNPVSSIGGFGVIMLPNTVARIKGGPGGALATRLIDFLLSPEAQALLAQTDSRNLPVDSALRTQYGQWGPNDADVAPLDLERVTDAMPEAMAICGRVLGG